MVMNQAGPGEICLFDDFFGGLGVASTMLEAPFGQFRAFGNGIDEADSGIVSQAGLNGVGRLNTTDEAEHAIFVGTNQVAQAKLNGHLVIEARVSLPDLDTKEVFIGFADVAANAQVIEGGICHGATTTITLTASDICGFLLSAELTKDEMWHFVYNGGASAGVTDSTKLQSGVDAIAGDFNVLRVEVDEFGNAEWYIDGKFLHRVEKAVNPEVLLAAMVGVEAKGAAIETLDVDYLKVIINGRDWAP